MKSLNIDGLVAASFTPTKSNGDLNLNLVPKIVDYLAQQGIKGIYIAGSTGEGMSHTDSERMDLAAAYIEAAKGVGEGKMKSIVQVGHNSMRASAELAAHAESLGADAVSATPPGYFKPANEVELVDSLLPIIEASSNTPFYYYHIPFLSGIALNPMTFTDVAMDRLATFKGIKYSDGSTLYNLPLLQKVAPELEFLAGSDEAYINSLVLGYKGAVGSTYNFAAPLYQKVRTAFEAGDMEQARLWQARALEMIEVLFATCGRGGLKAMMRMVGIDCGPVRRPLLPVTDAQVKQLEVKLTEMGWFDWVDAREAAVV